MSFPLAGQPDSYPLVCYSSDTYINVALPPQVLLAHDGGFATYLPTTIHVQAGPGVGDFFVRHTKLVEGSDEAQELVIRLDRELSAKLFVFGLLGSLVVLAVAIAIAVFAPGRSRSRSELHDLALAIAAVALAVLPLRAVLVPAELEGQTFVDWLLGAGVVMLAAIALWWLAPRSE